MRVRLRRGCSGKALALFASIETLQPYYMLYGGSSSAGARLSGPREGKRRSIIGADMARKGGFIVVAFRPQKHVAWRANDSPAVTFF